ncbi:cytochrome d ubiquinol oxidase subunit II [Pseudoclavibacter sp. VKM Ac-2867]|uniref:cytochrome d ubiquinol oxidase subunit II n=1 Tax=Pseudoclavibacter sp. VKM Ac-2867 TaxID=2783829 RepID=UPI00188C2CD5|nr:cytochrome d ubiquinol oxidase subunit II [Pseudoclavibacter sp. VKM Ac-2867]MBF4459638.1 cytochrome d ubiquinol oxidase subunit II [Pseudoclavibacter sp. VKM Ac-2867]
MDLQVLWFWIVAFFFVGYFVLDGFDFGVGIALPFIGKDDTDRRVLINTIGPIWDLNETWVIVAGAALFASFPEWYATIFSGFYLPLLLILLALIVRGVSFEYRHQGKGVEWTRWFDWMIFVGSAVPALLWGVAFANITQGLALDENFNYIGSFFDLLNPYALLGGLTTLTLFFYHGLVFITRKTEGDIRDRARSLALKVGVVVAVLAIAFLGWTVVAHFSVAGLALAFVAVLAFVGSYISTLLGRDGIAFALGALTVAAAVLTLFASLFPNLLPNTLDPSNPLTITNGSSSDYTLGIMSWAALIIVPFVLGYQAWTFWVFRKRISRKTITGDAHEEPAVVAA